MRVRVKEMSVLVQLDIIIRERGGGDVEQLRIDEKL